MSDISLFGKYSGLENAVSNYVGVLMRMLHETSPAAFGELWRSYIGLDPMVGPRFATQVKHGGRIPDLLITQAPLSIHFETKLGDSFDTAQLEGHIDALATMSGMRVLVALGQQEALAFERSHQALLTRASSRGVHLLSLTFDLLLEGLSSARAPQAYLDVVAEFGRYLDEQDLLPRWPTQLTVVNCATTMEEFAGGSYMCPNTGGPYSHRRSRFFGAYGNLTVALLAEVRGRVVLYANGSEPTVDWIADGETRGSLIERAREILSISSPARKEEFTLSDLQVFVLGPRSSTDFRKGTPGGAHWSKKYFRNIANVGESAQGLATRLRGVNWQQIESESS